MQHPEARNRARHRRSAAVALAVTAALVLGACGSSDDPAATGPTTTAASATTEKQATTSTPASTTTEAAEPGDDARMPVEEDDAPTGVWVAVRWYTALEPKADDFRLGSAEGRAYEISADCDGSACELTLGAGNDGSYTLPGVDPLEGPPVTFAAEDDRWTSEEVLQEPCTVDGAEVAGDHVETEEVRELQPLRDEEGTIVALLGTFEFESTLTAAGRAAGCDADNETTGSQAVVMAPVDQGVPDGRYDLDGRYIMTTEVTDSTGKTNPLNQKGALATSIERDDPELAGSCEDGRCTGSIRLANGDGTRTELDLRQRDDLLVASGAGKGGCVDGTTGKQIHAEGAYDSEIVVEDLFPVVVYEGEAKVLMGRMGTTSTPTELGRRDPRCANDEHLEAWIYLVLDED